MSAPIFHDQPPEGPIAELGRYQRLAQAREHGLVMASMGVPYWIARQQREYVLCVLEEDRDRSMAALADYLREEEQRPTPPVIEPLQVPKFAVAMALAGLAAAFAIQRAMPPNWVEWGLADDRKIQAGEWWRMVTALTLHGDAEHLVSNLSLAIFVFAFTFARFGVGVGLLAIVLGGAAGNGLNTLAHLAEAHRSLGFSTALFAGLGLLTGAEIVSRKRAAMSGLGWPLLVPLGAGLAFLSLFGGGGGQNPDGTPAPTGNVDLLAHLFGLGTGIGVGWFFAARGWIRGISPAAQIRAAGVCFIILAVAWGLAISSGT